MDKLTLYQQHITDLLKTFAYKPAHGEVEVEIITDYINNHYQVISVGWQNNRRVYGGRVHLDIKDGKIWIQQNNTEREIAEELVEMGIPKSDIVIGFHSPFKRKFTEYAVG